MEIPKESYIKKIIERLEKNGSSTAILIAGILQLVLSTGLIDFMEPISAAALPVVVIVAVALYVIFRDKDGGPEMDELVDLMETRMRHIASEVVEDVLESYIEIDEPEMTVNESVGGAGRSEHE